MSSVHRQPGKPNWFCFFRDAKGKLRHRSTGSTIKGEAKRIAAAMQLAADLARSGNLSPVRARKLIEETAANIVEASGPIQPTTVAEFFRAWLKKKEAEGTLPNFAMPQPGGPSYEKVCRLFEHTVSMLVQASGDHLPQQSIGEYFESWTKQLKLEVSDGTYVRYKGVVKSFLEQMGKNASRSLNALSAADVQAYREALAIKVASGTVNTHLKVIRVALQNAVRRGIIGTNQASLVQNMERSDRHHRRAFSILELKRLYELASGEWRGMILFGLYGGGLRLTDAANLCENNIDLHRGEFWTATRKTKKTQILPLAKPLQSWLEERRSGDDPRAPLFPSLRGKKSNWLSNQFYELMSTAGLVQARDHQKDKTKKGRGERRSLKEISFHSLRHTATSLLKNAGVSDVIARDIVGHESVAVSRNYTHIDAETKRKALDAMPDVVPAAFKRQPELDLRREHEK